MLDRLDQEMAKFRELQPTEGLWERIESAPKGTPPPTHTVRHRVAAATLGLALFIGAAALLWLAFRGGTASRPAKPSTTPAKGVIQIREDQGKVTGLLRVSGSSETAVLGCSEIAPGCPFSNPPPHTYLSVPNGTRFVLDTNLGLKSAALSPQPVGNRKVVALHPSKSSLRIGAPPGDWVLVIQPTSPNPKRLAPSLSFGIDIVPSTQVTPSWLLAAVQRFAKSLGDANYTSGEYVLTTRRQAVAPDQVQMNSSVYFVLLHGHFVDYGAKVLAGAQLPRGSVATATFDVRTHGILDTSVGNTAPNLASMGQVTQLPVGSSIPSTAWIACARNGTTNVSSPQVQATADGAQLVFHNPAGAHTFDVRTLSSAANQNFGGTLHSLTPTYAHDYLPPGPQLVACVQKGQSAPLRNINAPVYARIRVVDPNGLWVPSTLDCTNPIQHKPLLVAGHSTEPAVQVARRVPGVLPGDALQQPGYPNSPWMVPPVRVMRNGRPIAMLTMFAGDTTWKVSARVCLGTGVALEPHGSTSPTAPPIGPTQRYRSAAALAHAIQEAGKGCSKLAVGVAYPAQHGIQQDQANCVVSGGTVTIHVFFNIKPLDAMNPKELRGGNVEWVVGENWLVATQSPAAARAVQEAVGGKLVTA